MSAAWRRLGSMHVEAIRARAKRFHAAAAGGERSADETLVPGHLRGTRRDPMAVMAEALSFRPALPPGRAR
jgi:hypothetical protein